MSGASLGGTHSVKPLERVERLGVGLALTEVGDGLEGVAVGAGLGAPHPLSAKISRAKGRPGKDFIDGDYSIRGGPARCAKMPRPWAYRRIQKSYFRDFPTNLDAT